MSLTVPASLLLLMGLAAPAMAGTTWHVDGSAPCPGDGSLAAPFCTIQAALVVAVSGDEILVEPGLYNELLDFLGKDVELRSVAGAATTIVDGEDLGTLVTFDGGESRSAVLSGFTLRNGSQVSSIFGSGIRCVGSSPTIADNVIETCSGSALALIGGSPLVIGNTIRDNSGGAGIFCNQGANAQIVDNHVLSNQGSGIQVHDSAALIEGNLVELNVFSCCAGVMVTSDEEVVIRGNVIRANSATSDYYGGLKSGPNTLVEDNVIADNRAYVGAGAVWADGSTFRNNLITGNDTTIGFTIFLFNGASMEGDVIADNPAFLGLIETGADSLHPVRLTRVTITGTNSLFSVLGNGNGPVILEDCLIADNPAGGVYSYMNGDITLRRCTLSGHDLGPAVETFDGGHISLESCIVWGNATELEAEPGSTIDATWSIVEGGWPGVGNSANDPLFANAAAGDYSLRPNSPAIDGGNPLDGVTGFDLAGTPRRLDGHLDVGSEIDRGALEFDNVKLATSSPAPGVLKIGLTGTPGLQTYLIAAPAPGSLPVEKWGTFGLNLSGPWLFAAWPGAPSSVQVNVAPSFSGAPIVLQALAGPSGQLGFTGNLSNPESIELP